MGLILGWISKKCMCVVAVLPARLAGLNQKEQHEEPEGVLLRDFGGISMELWALSQHLEVAELGDLASFPFRFLDEVQAGKVRFCRPGYFLLTYSFGLA